MAEVNPEVSLSALPAQSSLHARIKQSDFIDCYSVSADMSPRQAAEVITEFPGWARFLLVIRKLVTSPFGLSQDGPEAADKVGPFKKCGDSSLSSHCHVVRDPKRP